MKQYKNTKDNILNIKNKIQKSKIVDLLFAALILVILFLNLIYSQLISPYYFMFVNNDKKATIIFLQKIKNLSEYQRILEMNNNIYGPSVKEEIFRQENEKTTKINSLKEQLSINSKSRDIFFGLYQLFLSTGDKIQADDYLKKAREVDPSLK